MPSATNQKHRRIDSLALSQEHQHRRFHRGPAGVKQNDTEWRRGDSKRRQVKTKGLQQPHKNRTEPPQNVAERPLAQNEHLQNIAPYGQESNTLLRSDIVYRLHADKILLDLVEKWDSLPKNIKSAIQASVNTAINNPNVQNKLP